jgi:hypothetical protein
MASGLIHGAMVKPVHLIVEALGSLAVELWVSVTCGREAISNSDPYGKCGRLPPLP